MSISAVVSGAEVTNLLRGSGLAAQRVAYVEHEIRDLTQEAAAIATRTLDADAFRTALARRIDSDVASGKLSAEDARAIRQALVRTFAPSAESREETLDESGSARAIPLVASAYGQEDADSYLHTIAHGTFIDMPV
ncbi:hypothetical protein [Novosphingobium profundi]|uniref:hypothetical protein n=1 Tax=Novosphingobium profundi TaxID=1774954 RepID=UPI001CFE1348|nr:hypothetical protein [Novosphingobium profundi]